MNTDYMTKYNTVKGKYNAVKEEYKICLITMLAICVQPEQTNVSRLNEIAAHAENALKMLGTL